MKIRRRALWVTGTILLLAIVAVVVSAWIFFSPNTRYYQTSCGTALGRIDKGAVSYRHLEISLPASNNNSCGNFDLRLNDGRVLDLAQVNVEELIPVADTVRTEGKNQAIRVTSWWLSVMDGTLQGITITAHALDDSGNQRAIRKSGTEKWLQFPLTQDDVEQLLGTGGYVADSWHP